ncbi:hypothetical protein HMPREF0494_0919 [Limosilactobacillus antri DSM 16041]|uniref:Uncharacterized protein n=1 Tax=Limosilactobacillus antri DSM 16041 TaxID=525309 RepID=C8P6H5_9LACO|nr:hypothetical protein HMPREF0494_0919 [Limosilactobacillus antri DSM 16041]
MLCCVVLCCVVLCCVVLCCVVLCCVVLCIITKFPQCILILKYFAAINYTEYSFGLTSF